MVTHDGELVCYKWHEKELEIFASDAGGPREGGCPVGAGNELLVLWGGDGHERGGVGTVGGEGMRMGVWFGGAVRDREE